MTTDYAGRVNKREANWECDWVGYMYNTDLHFDGLICPCAGSKMPIACSLKNKGA